MIKGLGVLLLAFLLLHGNVDAQNWRINEFGPCPPNRVFGIAISNAHNDCLNRIYVSANAGAIYEWTYNNGEWVMMEIPFETKAKLIPITSGIIHDDSLERLYFAEWQDNGGVFEATYFQDTQDWEIIQIGANSKSNTGIVVGNGRGDGKNRVYVAGFDGIFE